MTKRNRPQAKTIATKKPPKRWPIAIVLLLILAIAGFIWRRYYYVDAETKALLTSVSQLNFSGTESQVVNKIKTLLEQVKSNPKSAVAWGRLAMNLDAHDFKNESIPIYKKAASLDPSDFRWPYFCAIVVLEMGKPDTLEWFERAGNIDPRSVPLLVKYGDALAQFEKKGEAIQKYNQALARDPRCAHAFYGLARIDFAKGDMDSSRKNLQKVLEINPNFGEAYRLLVSVCRKQNDTACVAKNSQSASRFTEKTGLADPVYSELVAEGESSIWYSFRGSQYFKNGVYESAINEFQTALRLRPDAQSHEDLGNAYSAAGKYSDAVAHYRSALTTHPSANNYFSLGFALAKSSEYSEAAECFQKAIEKKPDFAEAYFNLGVTYAKMKQMPQVLENLKHAIRINPDYAEAHFYLGQAYVAMKNRDAAAQEYEILSKLNPEMAKQLQSQIDDL